MNFQNDPQYQIRKALSDSGEELVAVVGLEPLLKKGKLKLTNAQLTRASKLQLEVYKRCKAFLENKKKPGPPKLNLPDIDFLDLQKLLTLANASDWIQDKIEDLESVELQLSYAMALKQALNYLVAILPKLPVSITSKKSRPSDFELSRFNRAYRTIDDPMTVLSDMEQWCLSRGQVQVLRDVYPNLASLIEQSLLEASIDITTKDPEFEASYDQMKQISVLMLSNTVSPDLQTLLQDNFIPQEGEESSASGGGTSPEYAESYYTKQQKAEQR